MKKIFKKIFTEWPASHVTGGVMITAILSISLNAWMSLLGILIYAIVREIGQNFQFWGPHEKQTWQVMVNDIGHFAIGGSLVTIVRMIIW